jgi:hypothetical protein
MKKGFILIYRGRRKCVRLYVVPEKQGEEVENRGGWVSID